MAAGLNGEAVHFLRTAGAVPCAKPRDDEVAEAPPHFVFGTTISSISKSVRTWPLR
jgi:hypothetical protein